MARHQPHKIDQVANLSQWQESILTLGKKDGHVATVWNILSPEEAHTLPLKETNYGYVDASILPPEAVQAAFIVAQQAGRLSLNAAKIERELITFGVNHDVTGLHADINYSSNNSQSPPINEFVCRERSD